MLLQLEQDCLDVYKRKVEQAAKSRAQLLQALSDAKLELSTLLSALGEKSFAGIVRNYLTMSLCQKHKTHEIRFSFMMHWNNKIKTYFNRHILFFCSLIILLEL